MSKSRINDLLRLSYVPRWPVIPTTRPQSVAEHSFRVACITADLVDRIPYSGTIQAVRWALYHDGPECVMGDWPGNLKTDFPEFKDMVHWMQNYYCPWYAKECALPSPEERAIVKLSDHLETLMFITEHIALPVEDGWVIHRERSIVTELVATMTGKYGWKNLPAIVDEILPEVLPKILPKVIT
jgi:5'-deoxynucleotidase YfbR-like HD superfamily hydrolase